MFQSIVVRPSRLSETTIKETATRTNFHPNPKIQGFTHYQLSFHTGNPMSCPAKCHITAIPVKGRSCHFAVVVQAASPAPQA
jgi:hypothetical protein